MVMTLVVGALIALAVVAPLLYVVVTWDHDVACAYEALPSPSDLGTKEFLWRCWLSSLTRQGWRKSIIGSPCPRITLQCPFALLPTDFAQLTTSLGFQKLALDQVPFIVPQVALSPLFVQLLGNSNFPASVRNLRIKAITICQLRELDMSFREKKEDQEHPDLLAVMVLTEKRFLESEIEFTVQTDLFDEQGTVWQSVTVLSVPFAQQTLLMPLSNSAAQLDPVLLERTSANEKKQTFACTKRNLAEFAAVSLTDFGGASSKHAKISTPLMWMLGQATALLQREKRIPELPLMCTCIVEDELEVVPLERKLQLESWTNESSASEEPTKISAVKFSVACESEPVLTGLLRTVGWKFPTANPAAQEEAN